MMTMSSYLDLFRDIPGDLIGEKKEPTFVWIK